MTEEQKEAIRKFAEAIGVELDGDLGLDVDAWKKIGENFINGQPLQTNL